MGNYEFTCFANDGVKNSSDIIYITVLPDLPQVTTAPVAFTYGTTSHSITFTVTATYLTTTSYTISVNGAPNSTGAWIPGTPFSVNLDNLWVGSYNYSVVVNDGMGENGTASALVTVIDDLPHINPSSGIAFYVGAKGNEIYWNVTDRAFSTTNYVIYLNGTTIYAIGSWSVGVPVIINVDALNVGNYNFSCVASDGLGGANVAYI